MDWITGFILELVLIHVADLETSKLLRLTCKRIRNKTDDPDYSRQYLTRGGKKINSQIYKKVLLSKKIGIHVIQNYDQTLSRFLCCQKHIVGRELEMKLYTLANEYNLKMKILSIDMDNISLRLCYPRDQQIDSYNGAYRSSLPLLETYKWSGIIRDFYPLDNYNTYCGNCKTSHPNLYIQLPSCSCENCLKSSTPVFYVEPKKFDYIAQSLKYVPDGWKNIWVYKEDKTRYGTSRLYKCISVCFIASYLENKKM